MGARVIGLGQRLAGDDAVGLVVIERLRERGVPDDVELFEAREPSALVHLLNTPRPVVVVDAVVGKGSPGDVIDLEASELEAASDRPVSTHGLDVLRAIGLARLLSGASPRVRIVGVRVAPPERGKQGLSAAVASAVDRAARIALARATLTRAR